MVSRGQRLAYLAKHHNMTKRHVSGSYVEQWITDCEKSDYGVEKKVVDYDYLRKHRIKSDNVAKLFIRRNEDPSGLEKRKIDDYIGHGVFTTAEFFAGEFLVEYHGELLRADQAESIENRDYLYFFKFGQTSYCIDATNNGRLGRYINDAPRKATNCKARVMTIEGFPHIIICAIRDLPVGTELRFDYGCADLPWRKHSTTYVDSDAASVVSCSNSLASSVDIVPPSVCSSSEASSFVYSLARKGAVADLHFAMHNTQSCVRQADLGKHQPDKKLVDTEAADPQLESQVADQVLDVEVQNLQPCSHDMQIATPFEKLSTIMQPCSPIMERSDTLPSSPTAPVHEWPMDTDAANPQPESQVADQVLDVDVQNLQPCSQDMQIATPFEKLSTIMQPCSPIMERSDTLPSSPTAPVHEWPMDTDAANPQPETRVADQVLDVDVQNLQPCSQDMQIATPFEKLSAIMQPCSPIMERSDTLPSSPTAPVHEWPMDTDAANPQPETRVADQVLDVDVQNLQPCSQDMQIATPFEKLSAIMQPCSPIMERSDTLPSSPTAPVHEWPMDTDAANPQPESQVADQVLDVDVQNLQPCSRGIQKAPPFEKLSAIMQPCSPVQERSLDVNRVVPCCSKALESDDVGDFNDVEPSSSDDERTIIVKHDFTKPDSRYHQGYRRIPTPLSWQSRDKHDLNKRPKTLSRSPHVSSHRNARSIAKSKSLYSGSRSSHGQQNVTSFSDDKASLNLPSDHRRKRAYIMSSSDDERTIETKLDSTKHISSHIRNSDCRSVSPYNRGVVNVMKPQSQKVWDKHSSNRHVDACSRRGQGIAHKRFVEASHSRSLSSRGRRNVQAASDTSASLNVPSDRCLKNVKSRNITHHGHRKKSSLEPQYDRGWHRRHGRSSSSSTVRNKVVNTSRSRSASAESSDSSSVTGRLRSASAEASSNLSNSSSEMGVQIKVSMKNKKTGKRIWDNMHCCYFCNEKKTKLSKHLADCHAKEFEVVAIENCETGSSQRKLLLERVTRLGDYYYNLEVLQSHRGCLILIRRPNPSEAPFLTYKDYGPCPGCLGFVRKKDLWRHARACPHIKSRQDDESTSSNKLDKATTKEDSNLLLSSVLSSTTEASFEQQILRKMSSDHIAEVAKQDRTILKFGLYLYEKHCDSQRELIRQSMRILARLVIHLRQHAKCKTATLEDYIAPEKFDDIVGSVKSLCSMQTDKYRNHSLVSPSFALKIGHHLKKCSQIVRGQALRERDEGRAKDAEAFLDLYNLEWSVKISTHALSTLKTMQRNKPNLLPCATDLVKLKKYQDERMQSLMVDIESNPTQAVWRELAEITASSIIVFNKRRGGEATKILVSEFLSRPSWHDTNREEFKSLLTPLELNLCKRLDLVQIQGKRRRTVPVLLHASDKEAIKLLIKHRNIAEVDEKNPFVFAYPSRGSLEPMRGHDCLRRVAERAELKDPAIVRSTKLRKYVATMSQIFSLSEVELDWLADHLGHDIRTHRQYYRLHESTVTLAKVSKLLLAVEGGDPAQWKGRNLDDITLEDDLADNINSDDEDCGVNDQENCRAKNRENSPSNVDRNSCDENSGTNNNEMMQNRANMKDNSARSSKFNSSKKATIPKTDNKENCRRKNRGNHPPNVDPSSSSSSCDENSGTDNEMMQNRADEKDNSSKTSRLNSSQKATVSKTDDKENCRLKNRGNHPPNVDPSSSCDENSGTDNELMQNRADEKDNSSKTSKLNSSKKATISRTEWSGDENAAVFSFFRKVIQDPNGKPPGKKACEDCMHSAKFHASRTWKHIKYKVKNIMDSDRARRRK